MKESDFLLSENCYKCEYKRKNEKASSQVKVKNLLCAICQAPCEIRRWKYCSDKCALEAKLEQDRNHWSKKVSSVFNFSVMNFSNPNKKEEYY